MKIHSGKHARICSQSRIYDWLFHNSLFLFLASFFWLFLRSGSRPDRLRYPCQQAAASVVTASIAAGILVFRRRLISLLKYLTSSRKLLWSTATVAVSGLVLTYGINSYRISQSWKAFELSKPSGPVGIRLNSVKAEKALFATIPAAMAISSPHRVVSVHNSASTSWSGSGYAHDSVNQNEVTKMIQRGILALTGKTDYAQAWQDIIPYQAGEIVGIKLNCNNGCYIPNTDMDPYAEVVNAVIAGLTGMGVPADHIWLVDPSRSIGNSWRARITNQSVLFAPRNRAYVAEDSPYTNTANFSIEGPTPVRPGVAFTEIDHLINMPQLKGHGGASITLSLKNHYGSAEIGTQGRAHWHQYIYQSRSTYGTNGINPLLAINLNPQFKDKTRLIIGDGLFGNPRINYDDPVLFQSFGNQSPEIMFFGVDPMAVDSVMFDYLQRECNVTGLTARKNDLHIDAANAGLGVMEHWDGDDTRKYSAIEYLEIDLDTSNPGSTIGDVSGDGRVSAYDAALVSMYSVGLNTFTPEQIEAGDVSGNGSVSSYDAALISQYVVGLIDKFPKE